MIGKPKLNRIRLAMVGLYPQDVTKINGGVEASTVYLIEGLKKIRDLDINVISWGKDIAKEKIITDGNVISWYLSFPKYFGNITLGLINKYIIRKKIKELKPDIVHFQNHINYAYLGLKPYCPTLSTVHGIIYKEALFDKGLINRIRRFPRIYLERICLRNNSNIICPGRYSIDMVWHLSKARFYFVPHPVSERYFNIQYAEIPNRILCAATISRLKNVLDLLKAINLLKDKIPSIGLNIAGEIKDHGYFRIIKKYIEENRLCGNVRYLGYLSEEQLLKEYGECCILVLPSLHENSPLVIHQAMAAGKAVVAYRVGGIPSLVEVDKTGFLVDCGDIKGLAEKIELLLCNKGLRLGFGGNAKKWALERFRTEIIAEKTYKIYKEILGREKNGL